MNANNWRWRVCLRCEEASHAKLAEKKKALDEAYGKLPLEEFDALRHEIRLLEGKMPDDTLREDWKIGIWDGKFSVYYSARCDVCGFKYNYKYTDDLRK